MAELLKGNYGDKVTIKYVDVIEDNMDEYPAADKYLETNGMLLPLTMINGEPALTGYFSYRELLGELEKRGL